MSKRLRTILWACMIALCAVMITLFFRLMTAAQNMDTGRARIENTIFEFEIARTPAQRERGLQERSSVPERHGMLFVFPSATTPLFWMKNTQVPLDMIWINRNTVVDITEKIPTQLGVPEDELTRYAPSTPVDAVLEVRAGEAARTGIHAGSVVEWLF